MKFLDSVNEFEEYYKNEEIVAQYDSYRNKNLKKISIRNIEKLLMLKQIPQGSKILEVGVGTGFLTEGILKKGHVSGLDTSDTMLDFSKKRFHNLDNLSLSKGNILDLSEQENDFDIAVTLRVLIHFCKDDILEALTQLVNCLKIGGLVIFDLPSKSLLKKLECRFKELFFKQNEVRNFMYSKKDVIKLTTDFKGIKTIHIYAVDHIPLFLPFYLLDSIFGIKKLHSLISLCEQHLASLMVLNAKWIVVCEKEE